MSESIGNFDEYAKSYDEILSSALGLFGNENSYYSFRKVELASSRFGIIEHKRILDFGCGVGSVINHLFDFFPDADIWGTDPSASSLEIAHRANPRMHCVKKGDIPKQYFDVVVISNVLHHVNEEHRVALIQQIASYLIDNGKIIIFEHNRLNPITRRIVDRCEFDEGVELLSRHSCSALLGGTELFDDLESGYFLFIPPFLKRFRKLEKFLSGVPLGAQFWQTARRVI